VNPQACNRPTLAILTTQLHPTLPKPALGPSCVIKAAYRHFEPLEPPPTPGPSKNRAKRHLRFSAGHPGVGSRLIILPCAAKPGEKGAAGDGKGANHHPGMLVAWHHGMPATWHSRMITAGFPRIGIGREERPL
jgi:hypothetical protein